MALKFTSLSTSQPYVTSHDLILPRFPSSSGAAWRRTCGGGVPVLQAGVRGGVVHLYGLLFLDALEMRETQGQIYGLNLGSIGRTDYSAARQAGTSSTRSHS